MKLYDQQWLFAQDLAKLITFTAAAGWSLSLRELGRTKYQEDHYRALGYSALPPGVPSDHEMYLAIDMYFRDPYGVVYTDPSKQDFSNLKKFGDFWKSLRFDNYWGGDWKKPFDPYHFGNRPKT